MVRASAITKCRRKARTRIPYGSGYITESHGYGKPDIFKTVMYHPTPPETPPVTAYYIDCQSLKEHRLGEPARPLVGRWRFQELTFKVYANVNGEYGVISNVTASEDETVDELVYGVIAQIHELKDTDETQNILPRREGSSFDLQYEGSSLFQKINTENRHFGQRIQLGDLFRREPQNVYELLWKEYDAQGRECKNAFYREKLYPIIDLTDEPDTEDDEDDDEDEDYEAKANTSTPFRALRLPVLGENLISLLSSSPALRDRSHDT